MTVPMLTPTYPGLPDLPAIVELQHAAPWVCWKAVNRDGKIAKLPINPRTGLNASVSDPHTWGDFAQADRFARTRKLNGVGIVLRADDELIGIDIDKCIDEQGNFEPWARGILDLGETYAETSPSGRGIRMFARGKMERTIKSDAAHVELYRDARYLTVTGNHVHGTPETIQAAPMTIEALIARVAAFQPAASPEAKAITPVAPRPAGGDFFATVNRRAMESLSLWVPTIFGAAARPSANGGYRVASKDLGRDLEEDLSIAPNGIVDFGTADMGDPQQGKRTPIDLAIEYGRGPDAKAAAFWLCGQLGVSPDAMGWDRDEFLPDDGYDASKLTVGERIDPETGEVFEGAASVSESSARIYTLPSTEVVNLSPEAAQVTYPSGLVGQIARWISATARFPQPLLSIAAALATVGAAAGRQIGGPTDTGTALYILCLAPTAGGKDHPMKQAMRLFSAAGLAHHLGPDEFMSMSAVVKTIQRTPLCFAPMDEFGDFMRRVYGKRSGAHERAIPKVLRTLWSTNFGPYKTPAWADQASEYIHAAHLTVFGASTHEQFYSALESGAAADGTLNRFLLFDVADRVAEVDPSYDPHIVPQAISDALRAIYLQSGELAATTRNDANVDPAANGRVRFLKWGDGTKALYDAYRARYTARMEAEPHNADALARASEMSIRVATIISIGRASDEVSAEDLQFAQAVVSNSMAKMIAGANDYLAENEHHANTQRVVRFIRQKGGRASYQEIMRAVRSLKARDLKDLLDGLCQAELIEREVMDPKRPQGGGRPLNEFRLRAA